MGIPSSTNPEVGYPFDPDGEGYPWPEMTYCAMSAAVADDRDLTGLETRGYQIRSEEIVTSHAYPTYGSALAEYPEGLPIRLRLSHSPAPDEPISYVGNDTTPNAGGAEGAWSVTADESLIGTLNSCLGEPDTCRVVQFSSDVGIIEEVDGDHGISPRISMSWTCATPLPQEELYPTQGYSFTPGQVGCTNGPTQRLTLRVPPINPKHVRLELYGNPNMAGFSALDLSTSPPEFRFQRGPVQVRGALVSNNGNGAQVRMDEVSIYGVELCTDGTHTLSPE